MKELIIITSAEDFEYFCRGCQQLRLWACGRPFDGCGNCGATDIVKGKPGSLDKAAEIAKLLKPDPASCTCTAKGRKTLMAYLHDPGCPAKPVREQ